MLNPKPRYRLYGGFGRYTSLINPKKENETDIAAFEKALSEYCKVRHVVCVPQNRVGLYVVIASQVMAGKKVVMTPYTVSDLFNMILLAGAKPVFCDVDRKTCNIDPLKVESILEKNDDIGAVVITHLHGLAVPMKKLYEICQRKNILLIEDAAQSFGAQYAGKVAGTYGDIGIYSFGMFKNLATWYGGAIVTDSDETAAGIRNFIASWKYQKWKDIFLKVKKGMLMDVSTSSLLFQFFTFRIFKYGFLNDVRKINRLAMTELDTSRKEKIPDAYLKKYTSFQAKIGLKQLPLVNLHNRQRIEHARVYYEGLKHIPQLIIPDFRDDFSHIYTYFPIQYENREQLLKYMMKNNRDVAPQHYKNCANLDWVREYHSPCPNADKVSKELIFLPTYAGYGADQVKKNIDVIQNYFSGKG